MHGSSLRFIATGWPASSLFWHSALYRALFVPLLKTRLPCGRDWPEASDEAWARKLLQCPKIDLNTILCTLPAECCFHTQYSLILMCSNPIILDWAGSKDDLISKRALIQNPSVQHPDIAFQMGSPVHWLCYILHLLRWHGLHHLQC